MAHLIRPDLRVYAQFIQQTRMRPPHHLEVGPGQPYRFEARRKVAPPTVVLPQRRSLFRRKKPARRIRRQHLQPNRKPRSERIAEGGQTPGIGGLRCVELAAVDALADLGVARLHLRTLKRQDFAGRKPPMIANPAMTFSLKSSTEKNTLT
jgi:hypothetical protein